MARRQQTTGRPRRDRGQSDVPQNSSFFDTLLGKPKNREEYQTALTRLINNVMRVFVGILVLALAAYLVYEFLWIPNQTVATVNGEKITVAQFRERVAFERGIVIQQYNIRLQQLQQQAAAFGMDVNQLAQQDQQLQTWQREVQFPDALGDRVLDDMIDELLIQQEFNALGLTLDQAQIDFSRQAYFGINPTELAMIGTPATATITPTVTPTAIVSPTPTSTPLPTLTPTFTPSPTLNPELTAEATGEATAELTAEATAELTAEVTEAPTLPASPTASREDRLNAFATSQSLFEEGMREADVSAAAINNFYLREATRYAVMQSVIGEVSSATYVNIRHILLETEEEANQVLTALNSGESFALLAQAHSVDTGSGQRGGELGWQPLAYFVAPFGEAAETAAIDAIVGPIQTDFGWHIIQVRGRESRPVSGQIAEQVQSGLFERWLADKREAADAAGMIIINDNWPDFLVQP
jgi:peptidyl-prolyl cis-trans isomerase D